MEQDPPILTVRDVSLSFGGLRALNEVRFEALAGDITAIIGPNGAGKTSILNCMTGFYRPDSGSILFQGQHGPHEITRTPTHRVARLGIARTFQNLALYTGLTTLDNLMAARHAHMKQSLWASLLYYGPARREELAQRAVVEEIIEFLELGPLRRRLVGTLPYGQRKRVELGRALALEPRLLLVDEPMAGMNQEEKDDIARYLLDIHRIRRIPIILVEHDINLVMDIADRIVVLDFGSKIADGTPREVQNNPDVIAAYLGQEVH